MPIARGVNTLTPSAATAFATAIPVLLLAGYLGGAVVDAMKQLQRKHRLRGLAARCAYLAQIVLSLVATAIAAKGSEDGKLLYWLPTALVWTGFVTCALFLLLEAVLRTSIDEDGQRSAG